MITTDMRLYDFFTFGEDNGYGVPTLSTEPKGKIKMAINISSQSTQDNILYKDYITMLIDETLEAEVMLIIDNKIHVKTNGHIYGIINYYRKNNT